MADYKKIREMRDNMHMEGETLTSTLFARDNYGHIRYWRLFIGIVDPETKELIPIKEEYFNHEPIPYWGATWTESGIVESPDSNVTSGKRYIQKGTNLARKNRTNAFTQAIKISVKRYKDKLTSGYSEKVPDKDEGASWIISPPLFHNINNNWDKVSYPCYIQPKIDGQRLISVYSEDIQPKTYGKRTYDHLLLFQRSKKLYRGSQYELIEQILELLKDNPEIYLDGEVGDRGESFQQVSGMARRENKEAKVLNYYIFDYLDINNPDEIFEDRLEKLKNLIDSNRDQFPNLIILETYMCHERKDIINRFKEFLGRGDEGAMVRMRDSKYEYSRKANSRRIYSVLKMKPLLDDEWPVIAYTKSKGSHEGAILWICKSYEGRVFKVNFAKNVFTIPQRQTIYNFFENNPSYFSDNFKDKLLTIKYGALTDDQIPVRGGAWRFRDEKVQKKLLDIIM